MNKHTIGLFAAIAVFALLAAGCGSDVEPQAIATTQAETQTTPTSEAEQTPPTTAAPTTTAAGPASTTVVPPEWITQQTGDDCKCADGSEFIYFTRTNNPQKVVLYFQGGGACFTAEMCSFEDGSYTVTADADDAPDEARGIFDFENPSNPFLDWSFVFVPYCTGDVHIGAATTEYTDDLTVEHNGFANATHGLDFVTENFPDATNVMVTGSSAGGVPAPLFGGLVGDALPDADIAVLADASGGYPSNPPVNETIGSLWGTFNNVPDWDNAEGTTAAEFGIPDLFVLAGNHNPAIRMARYDNAFDNVQRSFSALAGVGDGGLPAVLEQNEQLVEGAGIDLPVYIAPGDAHTILGRPEVYELDVEGVAFIDWLADFVAGNDPGDVRCVDCGDPDA